MSDKYQVSWKGLALGIGAHLEAVEAHCAVLTGKTGQAHADEGKELREAGKKFIQLIYHAMQSDSGTPTPPPATDAIGDAEVEAALEAYCERWPGDWDGESQAEMRENMRAALEAAQAARAVRRK